MPMLSPVPQLSQERTSERGAALLTMLLISMLILVAGGALIMTTALSATNAVDATAETQAYYAAEAGMQTALNVIRGNVAPLSPSGTASENLVSLRKVVSNPTLSNWITYNTTYNRVPLSGGTYSPLSGLAYSIDVSDPDATSTVQFSMSGSFPGSNTGDSKSIQVGLTNQDQATITYAPPTTNPLTITGSGTAPFGSFTITPTKASQFNSFNIDNFPLLYPSGIDFNLTITQTAPYPASSSSPITVTIPCKITGVISSTAGSNTVRFSIIPPTTNPTLLSNYIGGVTYTRTTNSFLLSYTTSTSITPITVTAPEPRRVLVKVIGYGPRASEKHMQMLVNRFALDIAANAAITLRSADDGSVMEYFDVGESAKYGYSGYDYSQGPGLPAVAVTNTADYAKVTTVLLGNTQVTGTSPALKVPISDLPTFLQTAQAARDAVDYFREKAKNEYWPVGTTGAANDRYFPSGTTPNTFGTVDDPLTTFVDGNASLPPAGGAGTLIVTGTLDMTGNADFKGLVLVLGRGKVLRNGGGNGTTLGSMIVARFDATGDFLPPYFDSNGTGIAKLNYDSKWVDKALETSGPSVRGVSEY
jgi:hypothetical protein